MSAPMVVLTTLRQWACPHCGEPHRMDHDLHDLANLECRECGRVTLGRLVPAPSGEAAEPAPEAAADREGSEQR